jgi:hypothetical protein
MTEANKKALLEAIKEIVRSVLIGIIPVMLLGIDVVAGKIAINWAVVGCVALVIFLKSIDKYLHIHGKEEHPEASGQSYGLVRL